MEFDLLLKFGLLLLIVGILRFDLFVQSLDCEFLLPETLFDLSVSLLDSFLLLGILVLNLELFHFSFLLESLEFFGFLTELLLKLLLTGFQCAVFGNELFYFGVEG